MEGPARRPWERTADERWSDLDAAITGGDDVLAMESLEALIDGHWAEPGVIDLVLERCRADASFAEVLSGCLVDDGTPPEVLDQLAAALAVHGLADGW